MYEIIYCNVCKMRKKLCIHKTQNSHIHEMEYYSVVKK